MALTKVTYPMAQGAPANILYFGADPTGIADSTAAIQAAIDSFPVGQTIYVTIPTGEYKVTSKITINRPAIIKGQGGRLIASVPNDYVFEVNDTDPTYPNDFEFDNVQIKWGGMFGSNTSGGINIVNASQVTITNCEFWALGLNAVKATSLICGVIEKNQFKEHLNNNEVIRLGNGNLYLVTVRDNFFQFTAPGKTKPCLYVGQVFNADISNNAFEIGSHGVYLEKYGTMYAGSVRNNFFEGNTVGLSLGNDNGDGYFGFFNAVAVESNIFTGNDTGILVAGVAQQVAIKNNSFDGSASDVGINVTSKRYNSLAIEGNNFINNIALANRIQGYAYPFGFSSVDATKVVVDHTDSTSGWTEQFDPSGFGTLSTSTPMPGVNASASLQLSYSSTPTDQYIVQKTISSTDLSNSDFFVVPFWVDDPAKLQSVAKTNWRILGIGPDSSNYWGFNIGGWSDNLTTVIRKGWNIMLFPKADAVVVAGSPASWSAVTYLQLRVVPLNSSSSPVVRFGGVFGFKLNGASAFAGSQVL